MTMNRRLFLGTSMTAVGTARTGLGPASLGEWPSRTRADVGRQHARPGGLPDGLVTLYDPQVKALALTALDAARSAGATYADVQLTYSIHGENPLGNDGKAIVQTIGLGLSVRALVQGYWGWAATPYISAQEAPRVGREATNLAQLGAGAGLPRVVDWGTLPAIADGHWQTPIRIDPFTLPSEEMADFCDGITLYTINQGNVTEAVTGTQYRKQERVLASTEGSYCTQTVHEIEFQHIFRYKGIPGAVSFPLQQGGWECVVDANVPERIQAELTRIDRLPPSLPHKSVLDLGRYTIVFTAPTVARLLEKTLVPATELDRALGYEANGVGTSYLGPEPLTQLGTQVASPLITLRADRSDPHGLTTVQWDDDRVVPTDVPIIQDGVLVNYQTTREQASWLAPWYQRHGEPVNSHGNAASTDALWDPMQQAPNITLQPHADGGGLDDLIAKMEYGFVVDGINVHTDWQCSGGIGLIGGSYGTIEEVRHGRRIAHIGLVRQIMFRSPELWKNVVAIGGPASLERQLLGQGEKGEPLQSYEYSLATVPILVRDMAVMRMER